MELHATESMEQFAIKKYNGTTIKVVAISEDAESHEKLMGDDDITLSWNDISGNELPVGAYITDDSGEKYRLLDPYIPEQVNESEWRYNPTFSSRVAAWSKVPLFFYTRNASGAVVSREPDWTLTDTAENFIKYIARAISEETGETWTGIAAPDLAGVQNVQFQSTDIVSGLNSIVNVFETEWRADKSTNTLYLGKAMFTGTTTPTLEVGVNINVPAVTENEDGYYNRFVVFGSTRNITQDYEGANVNNLVNKRLTLNPTIYPNSVIDRRQSSNEPAYTKILIFDEIYPKSNLVVIEARPRLMYAIKEGTTDEKIQIGTDAEGKPIYDQYAIWYLQLGTKAANGNVTPFRLANKQTYSKDNPDGVLIAGKNLSVHFSSGALNGREFELIYHDSVENVETSDGIPFEVKDGDFEIVYTKDNNFIVPSMTGIVPNVDDKAILFNLRMPAEYLAGAHVELKEAADAAIAEYESDRNNYEFASNPVAFNGNAALLGLRVGQKVVYKNGDYSYMTRVLSITRKLDYPCEQTIKVGNDRIKGSSQTLKEDVANASKDISLIASFNQLTQSTINNYNKMLAEMTAGFDRIKNMWRFHPDYPNVIFTEYTVLAYGDLQSKKHSEIEGGEAGAIGLLTSWSEYTEADKDWLGLSAGLGVDLHNRVFTLENQIGNGLNIDLSDYVTVNTAQTISGLKTLGLKEGEPQNHEVNRLAITPYGHTGGPWYINSLDNTSTAYLRIKYGTSVPLSLSHMGDLTVAGKIIKSGGTSSQFLKADGSVDSNTYLTSHQALDYINVKDIRNTTPKPNTMSSKKVTAWFTNNDKPGNKAWYSGLTVQGWNSHENYAAWQISASADVNVDDLNLYFRVGAGENWKSWQKVLTDANYASILDDHFVKKSGDTINGILSVNTYGITDTPFRLSSNNSNNRNACYIQLGCSDSILGYLGAFNESLVWNRNGIDNVVWHSGNDGADSGLDADLLDGYHEGSFLRYRAVTSVNGENALWSQIGIKQYSGALPDGLSGTYNYGAVISLPSLQVRCEFYCSHKSSESSGLWFRSGWNDDKKEWKRLACITDNVASASKLATARNFCVSDENGEFTSDPVSFDGSANVTLKLPYIVKAEYLWATDLVRCYGSNGGMEIVSGTSSYIGALRVMPKGVVSINFDKRIFTIENDYSVKFYRNLNLNSNSLYLNDSKRLWVDSNGVLRFNGTILADGDLQSKKASQAIGEVVEIKYPTGGSTVKIPSTASAVILQTMLDDDTITLKIEGDINDVEVIDIYAREFSAGSATIKFKTSSSITTQYTITLAHLCLVRRGTSVYLEKYS